MKKWVLQCPFVRPPSYRGDNRSRRWRDTNEEPGGSTPETSVFRDIIESLYDSMPNMERMLSFASKAAIPASITYANRHMIGYR